MNHKIDEAASVSGSEPATKHDSARAHVRHAGRDKGLSSICQSDQTFACVLLTMSSLLTSLCSAGGIIGFPKPPMSACQYSQLRFSHIDDMFGNCQKQGDGDEMFNTNWKLESVVGEYADLAWERTIFHGWNMAESALNFSDDWIDSNFGVGHQDADRSGLSESVAEQAYPFVVCSLTKKATSGYDNLRELLPLIGAVSSQVAFLSNKPNQSCFVVSAFVDSALNLALSRLKDFIVLPMTDTMKMDSGIIVDVCRSDDWIVPVGGGGDGGKQENTWERKIRVGLRPDLWGDKPRVLEHADRIMSYVKDMGKEGSRRRRRLFFQEEDKEGLFPSVTGSFSVTAALMAEEGQRRKLGEDIPLHHRFWSRTLREGIESDEGCMSMFEALSIDARFGNVGFDITLNPHDGKNLADDSEASANNPSCICSLIAALSTHPMILEVSANAPIELHDLQAQHLIQTGTPTPRAPFTEAGLTGKGETVSVSDAGLSINHCYFKNDRNGSPGDIFGGKWDMSERKVVSYDDTYADKFDNGIGHGTHVAGLVGGAVLAGSGSDPGSGVAPDAKLHFFDMAVGDSVVYDPGVARLFNSFYSNGNGAKIHIGSWGRNYQSVYSQDCQDIDEALFIYEDVLYVASAGNDGDRENPWRSIKNPADCKNSLAVGASQSYGKAIMSNDRGPSYVPAFSARGPTADGRTKPDLIAPGYMVSGAVSNPADASNCGFEPWAGTSMSAPIVAGAAALISQYFKEGWYPGGFKGSGEGFHPSGSLIKAVLMGGGQYLKGVQKVPNGNILQSSEFYDSIQNMGVINLLKSLPLFRYNQLNAMVVNNEEIVGGSYHVYDIDVKTCSQEINELTVTLVWMDPAAASNCQNCLVNDLDLTLKLPSGVIQFPNGLSVPDAKNNAERIRIDSTGQGNYKVIVDATNLATASQRYSLVATGCFSYDWSQSTQQVPSSDFFLDTLWGGGLKSGGSMFGIVAKSDINITSFAFHTPLGEDREEYDTVEYIDIYIKEGSHIGFERERSKWAQVASSIPIQGMGTGEATYVTEGAFPKIQMKKGEHKSVYISMTDREEMRYTAVMQEMGEVYSEDKNMQILVGSGNSYDQHGFGEFYPKRMWNGRIMYEKVQAEALDDIGMPTGGLDPSFFLETIWSGGMKNSGSMFDVIAKADVRLDRLQLNTPLSGMIDIEIYVTNGSHSGKEDEPNSWDRIVKRQIRGKGDGRPTTILFESFSSELLLVEGETLGLYVAMVSMDELRYSPTEKNVGEVFSENSDIQVLVGTGNDASFGEFYSKRVFNGAIGYKRVQQRSKEGGIHFPSQSPDTGFPAPPSIKSIGLDPSATIPNPSELSRAMDQSGNNAVHANPVYSQFSTLATLMTGDIKNSGVMFNIFAKSDIRINAFYLSTASRGPFVFEIYKIRGGHDSNELEPKRWIRVGTSHVDTLGEGDLAVIENEHFEADIIIESQELMGIYITMRRKTDLRYSKVDGKLTGDVYSEDDNISISVGTGNTYPFGGYWPDRIFNGGLEYQIISTRTEDPEPSSGRPFDFIDWNLNSQGIRDSSYGWSVEEMGFWLRFDIEDSYMCEGGTNDLTQKGQASSTITVGTETPLYFKLSGMGELYETKFESLVFEIDGQLVAWATSSDEGIECSSAPVQVTYELQSPIALTPGSHSLSLKFTTGDAYDHRGLYYELNLGFEP